MPNANNKECLGEVWPHTHTRHIFASLSSWEGHSLKGKQELKRKSWVLLAGGRLGCHGNCRVRSPGCCSASVGTHYATSHLSVSICLRLLFYCFHSSSLPLCSSPLFSLIPIVSARPDRREKWWEEGGMGGLITRWKEGERDWQMKRNNTESTNTLGASVRHLSISLHLKQWGWLTTAKTFAFKTHTHNKNMYFLNCLSCSGSQRARAFPNIQWVPVHQG